MQDMLTGQFMIGYVAVGIYLMESTGPAENWYPAAEEQTFNEIVQGLDWLANQASQRGHKLVWVYPPMEKVSTAFEPIAGNHVPRYEFANWVFDWLDDIYTSHGQSDEWDGAYGLANHLRRQYKTNWAVEIAVVMDDNDPDHMFSDSMFAYAALNCWWPLYPCDSEDRSPVVVITYNNDSWGPSRMDAVIAHEVSHVFGASDEYNTPDQQPPQCDDPSDCGPQQSYLSAENDNCVVCNSNSVDCYMRGQPGAVCLHTPPELGWRDSDGDGASDALDQNYTKYMWIMGVYAGDIIRIYNTIGQFLNVFAVTSDQITGPNRSMFWNGVQSSNDPSAAGIYVVTRNGQPHQNFQLSSTTATTHPINGHYFSVDTMFYSCPGMTLYLRHTVYDSLGIVFSRPRFDLLTQYTTIVKDDLTGYPDGQYTSEVSGWLSNGTKATASTLTFVNYVCGDATNDGIVAISDLTFLQNALFSGGPMPVHPASADMNGCDEIINVSDITHLIAYLFRGGPAPSCCHTAP